MNLQQQLGEWYPLLSHVFDQEWMKTLGRRIGAVPKGDLAPALDNIFRAFALCPPSKVKVVICLQDPYINGEADGLAMSSFGKMTPSLEVVFEEINRTHIHKRTQTHLDDWAVQGVLLINAALTTNVGKSRAHQGWGWEIFIHEVFQAIYKFEQPIVFMAWGKDAQTILRYKPMIAIGKYPRMILVTHHPQAQNYDPSKRFVGCNHFIEANVFLLKRGLAPIWWSDPDHLTAIPTYFAYETMIQQLAKLIPHVKIDLSKIMHSYPPVPDKPHPFDTGLQSGYQDQLPF